MDNSPILTRRMIKIREIITEKSKMRSLKLRNQQNVHYHWAHVQSLGDLRLQSSRYLSGEIEAQRRQMACPRLHNPIWFRLVLTAKPLLFLLYTSTRIMFSTVVPRHSKREERFVPSEVSQKRL